MLLNYNIAPKNTLILIMYIYMKYVLSYTTTDIYDYRHIQMCILFFEIDVVYFISVISWVLWFSLVTSSTSTINTDYMYRGIYQILLEEEFEDTKGEIRIRTSKKNRQHNGQKKKVKRTNNDQQNIHIKLKIEKHEPQ